MLLLFDNYDSFTYNIAQLLMDLGKEVEVVRNDVCTPEELLMKKYEAVVLSPGHGVPKEAGCLEDFIEKAKGRLPILGVCLGHQAIGEVFGAKVVRAKSIVHGKSSVLLHDGTGLYQDVSKNALVGRYHSLVVERESLPDCLYVTSELEDGMIMGLRHRHYEMEGIQFHPESILTPEGRQMMRNFLGRIA
ncbi:aminodeoxychorismate/anthranilate synthase component II [Selenomonas sp. TAMA-11512]|uniref:anthranilate synthase component II n=1 Tax=Selenomonas sp. TAMA-11512 TaxID=3095337 RepID=UPI0030867C7C|nr:aminodeoxychorismate/anthranilate synthase component II [Selenomonas sp. TAMA-11512]